MRGLPGPRSLLIDCLASPQRLSALGPCDWDRLLPQAREARMVATLWDLLAQQGASDRPPRAVRNQLWGAWRVALHRNVAFHWELRCLGREFPVLQRGRPVLLKGAAYIAAGLPHARARICGDIDVLVPAVEIEAVERGLYWRGWAPGNLNAYDEGYYRQWMHQLPPLMHRRRGSTLDLHHNILPPTAQGAPDPTPLLEHAEALAALPGFAVPTPAHMILHSAAHLFADSEWDKAVRDFYDLDRMIRYFAPTQGRDFWEEVLTGAEIMRRERDLFYALRYCRGWFDSPVPDWVIARVGARGPNAPRLWLMDGIYAGASAAHACGPSPRRTALCRGLLYIRSHWLKMPPVMLARHLFHKAFLTPREQAP